MSEVMEFDSLDYHFSSNEVSVNEHEKMPEQTLWCAVLNQAFVDAQSGCIHAREWLLFEREDFVVVCSLAGVSPFSVRKAARRLTRNATC